MADNILANDLVLSSNSIKPWHWARTGNEGGTGQTTVVDGLATIEQAMEFGGLKVKVAQADAFALINDVYVPIPDVRVNYATDNQDILGLVSSQYKLFQYSDMAKLGEQILNVTGASIETALTLRNRRMGVIQFALPGDIKIAGHPNETHKLYLLLTTGHGGKLGEEGGFYSLRGDIVDVRAVCENTVKMAWASSWSGFSYQHTGNMHERVEEARRTLQITINYQKEIEELMNKLVELPASAADRAAFLDALVPVPRPSKHHDPVRRDEINQAAKAAAERRRDQIAVVHEATPDLADVRWTKYGLLQGVSAWETHHRRFVTTATQSAGERRYETIMGLGGETLTERAGKLLAGKDVPGFNSAFEREFAELVKI